MEMEIYVQISFISILFPYFLFLFWFSNMIFCSCVDFTRIAVLYTSDDVTN